MPLTLFTVGSILTDTADKACDLVGRTRGRHGSAHARASAREAQSAEYRFFQCHPELFKPVSAARDIRRERAGL
jgi:hypothetical protein